MDEDKEKPGQNDRNFPEGEGGKTEDEKAEEPADLANQEQKRHKPCHGDTAGWMEEQYVMVEHKDIEDIKPKMAEKGDENVTKDEKNGAGCTDRDNSQSPGRSARGTCSQDKETNKYSLRCPQCPSTIAYATVNNQDTLNIQISTKSINEEKENVSCQENEDQAAGTQRNSLWCPQCEVNHVLFSKVESTPSELNIKLYFEDETNMLPSKKDQQRNEEQSTKHNWVTNIFKGFPRSTVKIYPFITGKTFGAHEAIMKKLKNSFWSFSTFVEEARREDSDIIIVFCPITSRVGSDVESAMTDLKGSWSFKPVILVLMHHTRDPDYSTAGIKWSEMYTDVKLVVHVLFHETIPGLLNCQQNNQAIKAIEQKVHNYKK